MIVNRHIFAENITLLWRARQLCKSRYAPHSPTLPIHSRHSRTTCQHNGEMIQIMIIPTQRSTSS